MKTKVIIAWAAVFSVFLAILWAIRNLLGDFASQPLSWSQIRYIWILPAGVFFFLGMVPSQIYWHQILVRFGIKAKWTSSFAAFFISQLGKYVPGKVMVLGIRMAILGKRSVQLETDCELGHLDSADPKAPLSDFERSVFQETGSEEGDEIRNTGLNKRDQAVQEEEEKRARRQKLALIAAASFMETIMFMAVGTVIGCMIGVYFLWDHVWLAAGCMTLALALVLPTLPPVFRFLAKIQPIRKLDATLSKAVIGWDWKAVGVAWLILPIGWLSLGTSLFVLIQALPDEVLAISDLPRCVCGASLSSVLGFVSLLPGGFGVRELVLYPILHSRFRHAIVLAILFRLTSLVGELMAAAISQVLVWFEPESQM